jgi:hypothetical protein
MMTQNDQYRQYAREAQRHLEHASSDADKVVWLLVAKNWLNFLPQGDPKTR